MTNDDYQHRPPHLRLANASGRWLGLSQKVSLDPNNLLESARSETGLEDFGPDNWRDGLERLCEALQDEAQLNLIGRLSARTHILQLLSNRLLIEADRKADAEIGEQTIEPPIIITGLPRTGSTLLHGLLSQDPALRVPWGWEVMFPSPPPGKDPEHDALRFKRADRQLRWVHRLAPQFRTVHPLGADLAQECIAITAHDFCSIEFHTTFDVPSYQRWLDEQQQIPAMAYHTRFLQHLQRHTPGRRWALKAPAHLNTLPALSKTYPGARFIQTHRDPVKVVGSIASHGVILRSAFSDNVDIAAVADFWMRWWAAARQRAVEFRRDNPQETFIDVEYQDFLKNPAVAVMELYDKLGLELSDDTMDRMRHYLNAHPQDQHGKHQYSLDRFGLRVNEIEKLYNV